MTPFERRSVWLTTAGTLITGLVYWWMKEMMTPPEPWAVVNHPLQPWVLKAHILIAPLQVFAVGLITSRHVWRHFRMGVKKGRKSGLIAAGTFVALVLTGYALQVVTAELLIRALAWSHLGLGVVYSVGVAAHWPATRSRQAEEAGRDHDRGTAPTTLPRAAASGGVRVPGHERRRRTGSRRETSRDRS
ncbi:MAG: hypothetical protein R6U63_11280 [Longimicrobiales bacterium]